MKNSIRFFCTFLMVQFCLISYAQSVMTAPKKLWTMEQVVEMAKKYNLQDSVVLPRNAFLVYVSKRGVEDYLQRHSVMAKSNQEWKEYLVQTKYVRTFDEHTKLVDASPAVRKGVIKMHGGEAAYQAYNAVACQFKWRIYRSTKGEVAFFRADQPIEEREFQYGTRVDNLPKN